MPFRLSRKKTAGEISSKGYLSKTYRSVVDSVGGMSKKALFKIINEDNMLLKSFDSYDYSSNSKEKNLGFMNWGISGLGFYVIADWYENSVLPEVLEERVYRHLPDVVNKYASFNELPDTINHALDFNDGSVTNTLAVGGLVMAGLSALYFQKKRHNNKIDNFSRISEKNKIKFCNIMNALEKNVVPSTINSYGLAVLVGTYLAG